MRWNFRTARSCCSRISVQASALRYCSFRPSRSPRMGLSLQGKWKHNPLPYTGSGSRVERAEKRAARAYALTARLFLTTDVFTANGAVNAAVAVKALIAAVPACPVHKQDWGFTRAKLV